ncbi:MAG: molybdenum cofactor cytidylyltransferase [Verrucomicrobiota bacterium]|jgi:molybdenum cofactor cytidylyltransferase
MASVSGVLLAAGSSERLGFPKQLIQIGKEPLIRRTARIALEVFPLTVILGYKSEDCRAALAGLDLALLQNPNCRTGLLPRSGSESKRAMKLALKRSYSW